MVKTLRNQKGITLIELLAVIVIIGIVAAIAVPAIGKTIDNAQTKADQASKVLVEETAVRYALDGNGTFTNNQMTVSIGTLVSQGYLNASPSFKKLGYTDSTNITVTKNPSIGSFEAELPTPSS